MHVALDNHDAARGETKTDDDSLLLEDDVVLRRGGPSPRAGISISAIAHPRDRVPTHQHEQQSPQPHPPPPSSPHTPSPLNPFSFQPLPQQGRHLQPGSKFHVASRLRQPQTASDRLLPRTPPRREPHSLPDTHYSCPLNRLRMRPMRRSSSGWMIGRPGCNGSAWKLKQSLMSWKRRDQAFQTLM